MEKKVNKDSVICGKIFFKKSSIHIIRESDESCKVEIYLEK